MCSKVRELRHAGACRDQGAGLGAARQGTGRTSERKAKRSVLGALVCRHLVLLSRLRKPAATKRGDFS